MTAPPDPGAGPLLSVRDLRVSFAGDAGTVQAVNGVSFDLRRGERLGIAGESGAGKSVAALSLLRLVPTPPATISGQVRFGGVDLLTLGRRRLRRVRGARIAMIFQDPASCLSPRLTVGAQIVEAIRAHTDLSRRAAHDHAVDLLGRVGIPAPRQRARDYPHRLSGGMAQRVMIAIALSSSPDVVIADEPTTALDVTIEAQIIDLLASCCEELGTAVLLITHDLAVLARFADRVGIMYAGRLVEQGPVDDVYAHPAHPYTRGLMSSITRADEPHRERLCSIPGTPPSAVDLPPGCAFHPRCVHAVQRCQDERPELLRHEGCAHPSACHRTAELEESARAGELP